MDRDAEVALARSAAPASIASAADVMVLGPHGYETAVKGTNGFVCLVYRGWAAPKGDPDFWNPKLRGPVCLNPAAVPSQVPMVMKRTQLVLAGASEDAVFEGLKAAFDRRELIEPTPDAMSYMMSKDQYLGDANEHWRPHLMFFKPLADSSAWGQGAGSPVIIGQDAESRVNIFMIPVLRWSDGTPAPPVK